MFPRSVVLAESGSGEALGENLVISMVCSLGVNPDDRRDSRQGVSCGKEVLNDLRNTGTGRCVSLEAASAAMFSTLEMLVMDAWVFS